MSLKTYLVYIICCNSDIYFKHRICCHIRLLTSFRFILRIWQEKNNSNDPFYKFVLLTYVVMKKLERGSDRTLYDYIKDEANINSFGSNIFNPFQQLFFWSTAERAESQPLNGCYYFCSFELKKKYMLENMFALYARIKFAALD